MKPRLFQLAVDTETPITLFKKLCQEKVLSFLFESAEQHGESGRYSFIGFDSLFTISLHNGNSDKGKAILEENGKRVIRSFRDPLKPLKAVLRRFQNIPKSLRHNHRFQSGLVGYFGYDLVKFFEPVKLPETKHPILADLPDGIFFFPKTVIEFDHLRSEMTILTYDENPAFLDDLKKKINSAISLASISSHKKSHKKARAEEEIPENAFFLEQAAAAKNSIASGECIQVVLSQQFEKETDLDDLSLYRKLRHTNPSPYMYLMRFSEFSIIGSSPETLVRVEGKEIVVRPIAGTRPRGKTMREEKILSDELLHSKKELAEHRMLVDLGRHDVGRVSEVGSVRVTKLLSVERYAHVMHLVSEVRGTLAHGKTAFDAFRSCFPAGTLTGAPKIRAMQLISELEGVRRGIYGGAIGYFDISGNMDFAIAIRTMMQRVEKVLIQSGAGIVYDSLPKKEHEECFHKAFSCLSTLSSTTS